MIVYHPAANFTTFDSRLVRHYRYLCLGKAAYLPIPAKPSTLFEPMVQFKDHFGKIIIVSVVFYRLGLRHSLIEREGGGGGGGVEGVMGKNQDTQTDTHTHMDNTSTQQKKLNRHNQ